MRKYFWQLLLLLLPVGMARGSVSVLTYHNDNARTGQNLDETILTPANVNTNTFGKLFTCAVDGDVYAQPLYVPSLSIIGAGVRNVVFVCTEHNSVYAFDADTNGGPSGGLLWQVNLGPSAATPTPDFGNRYGGFTQITPEVGITGTPVINLAASALYVDAFTHEGTNYIHRVHALNIHSGKELPGSPVVVSAEMPGTGAGSGNGVLPFESEQQLQRCALTLASGYLYVSYCGYADSDPYHGWILGFNAANLKPAANRIFNTTPNSDVTDFGPYAGQAGIWMGGGGPAVDAAGDLYFTTGNGSFDAYNGAGGTEYGDSYVKLSTARGLAVADYFTPYDQADYAANDIDAGSGGVLLVPTQPGPLPRIMVSAGKPEVLYVIDRDAFTVASNHYNAGGSSDAVVQSIELNGGNFSTPSYFNGKVYLTPANNAAAAFAISNGMLALPASSIGSRVYPFPGATASISANGTSGGIAWMVERPDPTDPAILVADDAENVANEIYNSSQAGVRDQLSAGVKYAVPTVANGKVFVGSHLALSVFGLLGLTPSGAPAPGNYSGLFYGSGGVVMGQSGLVSITVGAKGHYTARLQTPSGIWNFTGQFYGPGIANNSLTVLGQSPLQIQLQYAGPGQLAGTVGNAAWSAGIIANQSVFNARTNPSPFAGAYTLAINGPGNGDSLEPQGNGYGAVTITTAGQLSFHGMLADGTPVSQISAIGANGLWPFYAPLYAGRGEILGWVNFANNGQADLSGGLVWTKEPAARAASYPAGFEFAPVLQGSHFTAGTVKAPLLDFNAGTVILNGVCLPGSLTDYFTVGANQRLIGTNRLAISFSPATGLFTGAAPNPFGARPLVFSGMFMSRQNFGRGYFVNSNLSGTVFFGPR
ncbi:MAG TPA: hypothetical protein VGO59_17365 [Verrucomicrobiae bacterium]